MPKYGKSKDKTKRKIDTDRKFKTDAPIVRIM